MLEKANPLPKSILLTKWWCYCME